MGAMGKAKSAVLFARETRLLEAGSNVSDGVARTALLSAGYVLMEGGVPIVRDGVVVGGVGVSGVQPQQDQEVAKAAVEALTARLTKTSSVALYGTFSNKSE